MCDWVGMDCPNHGSEGRNLEYQNVLVDWLGYLRHDRSHDEREVRCYDANFSSYLLTCPFNCFGFRISWSRNWRASWQITHFSSTNMCKVMKCGNCYTNRGTPNHGLMNCHPFKPKDLLFASKIISTMQVKHQLICQDSCCWLRSETQQVTWWE